MRIGNKILKDLIKEKFKSSFIFSAKFICLLDIENPIHIRSTIGKVPLCLRSRRQWDFMILLQNSHQNIQPRWSPHIISMKSHLKTECFTTLKTQMKSTVKKVQIVTNALVIKNDASCRKPSNYFLYKKSERKQICLNSHSLIETTLWNRSLVKFFRISNSCHKYVLEACTTIPLNAHFLCNTGRTSIELRAELIWMHFQTNFLPASATKIFHLMLNYSASLKMLIELLHKPKHILTSHC